MFKNKPWKSWTTRKITLIFSIFAVIAYIITAIILTIHETPLSDTLTEQIFIYFTALPLSGCAITIAKVVKGKTNTDKDEIESESEEYIETIRDESNEYVKEVDSEIKEPALEKNKSQRIIKGELI